MPIAQLNIAQARYPMDDPRMGDFVKNITRMNAIADRSNGFIWRWQEGVGDASGATPNADPPEIFTLSTWATSEDLETYVFGTLHAKMYRRGKQWFEAHTSPNFVIWPIADGHTPTIEEARAKLADLTAHGPTDDAYGWAELKSAKLSKEKRCA